jgi:hypothetical protein
MASHKAYFRVGHRLCPHDLTPPQTPQPTTTTASMTLLVHQTHLPQKVAAIPGRVTEHGAGHAQRQILVLRATTCTN